MGTRSPETLIPVPGAMAPCCAWRPSHWPLPATPGEAVRLAGEQSRTTHAAPEPVDACRYFAGLIIGALQGESKDRLLAPRYAPEDGLWEREPLRGCEKSTAHPVRRVAYSFAPRLST